MKTFQTNISFVVVITIFTRTVWGVISEGSNGTENTLVGLGFTGLTNR